MDKLLTIWPAYAPAVALVGYGLAMRSLWGIGWTIVVVWVARVVFVVTGIAWEVSTDSPFGIRVLNGIFAAIVVSLVFSRILESLCAAQKDGGQSATLQVSQ